MYTVPLHKSSISEMPGFTISDGRDRYWRAVVFIICGWRINSIRILAPAGKPFNGSVSIRKLRVLFIERTSSGTELHRCNRITTAWAGKSFVRYGMIALRAGYKGHSIASFDIKMGIKMPGNLIFLPRDDTIYLGLAVSFGTVIYQTAFCWSRRRFFTLE